jgi:hypothetical protein
VTDREKAEWTREADDLRKLARKDQIEVLTFILKTQGTKGRKDKLARQQQETEKRRAWFIAELLGLDGEPGLSPPA